MTVTDSGMIYIKESGGGGGVDTIAQITSEGQVDNEFLTSSHGISSKYGGDIAAVGEDLIFMGSSATPWGTYIQHWDSNTKTITDQYFEGIAYYSSLATTGTSHWFGDSNGNEIRKVLTSDTSSEPMTESFNAMFYDKIGERILLTSGGTLKSMSTTDHSVTTLATVAGANFTDITVDTEGRIYLSCSTYGIDDTVPCSSGSIWRIAPDGSPYTPLFDSAIVVRSFAFDQANSRLVILVGNQLYTAPIE